MSAVFAQRDNKLFSGFTADISGESVNIHFSRFCLQTLYARVDSTLVIGKCLQTFRLEISCHCIRKQMTLKTKVMVVIITTLETQMKFRYTWIL